MWCLYTYEEPFVRDFKVSLVRKIHSTVCTENTVTMATEMQERINPTNAQDQQIEFEMIKQTEKSDYKMKYQCACLGLIIAILMVIGIGGFAIYYISDDETSSDASTEKNTPTVQPTTSQPAVSFPTQAVPFCTTDACFNLASDIKRSMNSSVNPCNNFFEFV